MNKERRGTRLFSYCLFVMASMIIFQLLSFSLVELINGTNQVHAVENINSQKKIKTDIVESEKEPTTTKNSLARAGTLLTKIQVGDFEYNLYSDQTAILINALDRFSGIAQIPNTVTHNGTSYPVVKIEDNAFGNEANDKANKKITGLRFSPGSNLEVIGARAFQNCENLTGSLDFSNCTKLLIIWDYAFRNTKIERLIFGEKSILRDICSYSFQECYSLLNTEVHLPASLRHVGHRAFLTNSAPQTFSALTHNTVLELTGELPTLQNSNPVLSNDAKNYESWVDSSKDPYILHKSAKWLDEKRTTAEIRIDYGEKAEKKANLDVVFVQDHSDSMQLPATAYSTVGGEKYSYHRSFYLDDIVNGAAKLLLDTPKAGYDNRVSLVAFSHDPTPIYATDFTKKVQDITNQLISVPNMNNGATNYSGGLRGAIDIIKDNQDPDRIPVVIFLSDGQPFGDGEDFYGLKAAEELRNLGVKVYPIGIYVENNALGENLKNISYDGKTQYLAENSESFVKIMEQVLDDVVNSIETLDVKIKDVLNEEFEFTGEIDDIVASTDTPSKKTATVNGKTITWDLNGCDKGVTHTLKIKVKLKAGTELTASGVLPTNDELGTEDGRITSTDQPELERYLAHHQFENATYPGTPLPEEIMDLKPDSKGGYADQTVVNADNNFPTTVNTKDGQRWEFVGWDETTKKIDGADVTFVGKWKYVGYHFSFIKLDDHEKGLKDVEFSLYAWKGIGIPSNKELVTTESITAGKWQQLETQVSQADGRVDLFVSAAAGTYFQLVETKTPNSYLKPSGQWRFTLAETGLIKDNQLIGIAGDDGQLPPEFKELTTGEYAGYLSLKNETRQPTMPETGGKGKASITLLTVICSLIGLGLSGVYTFNVVKKNIH